MLKIKGHKFSVEFQLSRNQVTSYIAIKIKTSSTRSLSTHAPHCAHAGSHLIEEKNTKPVPNTDTEKAFSVKHKNYGKLNLISDEVKEMWLPYDIRGQSQVFGPRPAWGRRRGSPEPGEPTAAVCYSMGCHGAIEASFLLHYPEKKNPQTFLSLPTLSDSSASWQACRSIK